jgi:hypothetical protein
MMIAPPPTAPLFGTDLFQERFTGPGLAASSPVASTSAPRVVLIGSIPGVLIGSQLTVKLPDRSLRVTLALVLASGIKLLDPPGANAIILTVVAVALVVGITLGSGATSAVGSRRRGGRSRGGPAGAVVSWQPELPVARGAGRGRRTARRGRRPTETGWGSRARAPRGPPGYDGVMFGLPGSD